MKIGKPLNKESKNKGMTLGSRLLCSIIIMILGIEQTFSQEYQQSFEMHIPNSPDLVTIDGKPTVYYELHLTNFGSDSMYLNKLDIVDTNDTQVVMSFGKDNLMKRFSRIGVLRKAKEILVSPGTLSVIYIEFALQKDKLNTSLAHRLEFETLKNNERKMYSIQGSSISLSKKTPLVLGAPLSAGPWAAVYDPSWERGHRRVIYTVDGKTHIPGRFAIDFIKLDGQGRYAKYNADIVKNWYGYGNDILAVANGVVASTRNDFSESPTLSEHPKYTADKATGNYISLDIGNNQIVFYEHLKPGSIKVKTGQQVKKGDVIASIGFTGQSTGPHLHLHVANANSPLGAEGIPFAFERFSILGSYIDFEKFGKVPWTPARDTNHLKVINERPAPNSVIEF